jgi:hypothetical protein
MELVENYTLHRKYKNFPAGWGKKLEIPTENIPGSTWIYKDLVEKPEFVRLIKEMKNNWKIKIEVVNRLNLPPSKNVIIRTVPRYLDPIYIGENEQNTALQFMQDMFNCKVSQVGLKVHHDFEASFETSTLYQRC